MGFFGFNKVPGGVVSGSVLGSGGLFGPVFNPPSSGPPPGNSNTGDFLLGANSNGPFNAPPNNPNAFQPAYGEIAATPAGNGTGNVNPNPFLVNGVQVVVFGDISSFGVDSITVCVPGVVSQALFTNVQFIDQLSVPYTLTTLTANFNTDFVDAGFSIWTWQPVVFPTLPFFGIQNATFNW